VKYGERGQGGRRWQTRVFHMADTSAAKRRLIDIVKARSFSTGGETKLVSGRSTSFYFDMKPSMLHPEGHFLATSKNRHIPEGEQNDGIF